MSNVPDTAFPDFAFLLRKNIALKYLAGIQNSVRVKYLLDAAH
jgi:hypothetical protein